MQCHHHRCLGVWKLLQPGLAETFHRFRFDIGIWNTMFVLAGKHLQMWQLSLDVGSFSSLGNCFFPNKLNPPNQISDEKDQGILSKAIWQFPVHEWQVYTFANSGHDLCFGMIIYIYIHHTCIVWCDHFPKYSLTSTFHSNFDQHCWLNFN